MIVFSLAIGLVFFSLMLVLFQFNLIWYAEAIIFVAITLLVIDSVRKPQLNVVLQNKIDVE